MFKKSLFIFFAACILSISLTSLPATADDGVLPSQVFTAIMLKALNYDRNIDRQAKDKIVIGILSSSDDAAGQGFAGEVKDDIDKLQSSFLIKDKPIEADLLAFDKTSDKAKLEDQFKKANVSVLVVAFSDAASVNNVLGAARELQVSSICKDPGCAQNGIGFAIIQRDSKPHMMVNLDSLKQEGSDYNSKFLAMCEVVK